MRDDHPPILFSKVTKKMKPDWSEDKYVCVLYEDKRKREKNKVNVIRYKIVPKSHLTDKEKEIYKSIEWYANNRSGTTTKRRDERDESYCFIEGDKDMVEQSLREIIRSDWYTKYVEFVPMKKKTREHFGDIVESRKEEQVKSFDHICIIKSYFVNGQNQGYVNNKLRYIIKPITELTSEESDLLFSDDTKENIFQPFGFKIKGFKGKNILGADMVDFILGKKEDLESEIKALKSITTNIQPIVPLKDKTREHFGGIVEGMKERIEDIFAHGESYVLILKSYYEPTRKKGEIDRTMRYMIKPVDMITPEESDVLNSNRTQESHAYMHGYEARNVLGADEVEFIFDTEEELKDEIKELKSLTDKIYPIIPMKAKTREHFGDIMEKVSFSTLVSALLEKYELDQKIVAPALKLGKKVLRGKRGDMHATLLEKLNKRLAVINNISEEQAWERMSRMREAGKLIEGFIDIHGRFTDRQQAFDIMNYFKTIKHDPLQDRGPTGRKYFSEDIPIK